MVGGTRQERRRFGAGRQAKILGRKRGAGRGRERSRRFLPASKVRPRFSESDLMKTIFRLLLLTGWANVGRRWGGRIVP
jgi:hypothetical protein